MTNKRPMLLKYFTCHITVHYYDTIKIEIKKKYSGGTKEITLEFRREVIPSLMRINCLQFEFIYYVYCNADIHRSTNTLNADHPVKLYQFALQINLLEASSIICVLSKRETSKCNAKKKLFNEMK